MNRAVATLAKRAALAAGPQVRDIIIFPRGGCFMVEFGVK